MMNERQFQEHCDKQALGWACGAASDWGWTWEWSPDGYMDVCTPDGWHGVTSREFVTLVSSALSDRRRRAGVLEAR